MSIKNIASQGYFFIKHEKLQLPNNYALDFNNVELLANEAGYVQYLQETLLLLRDQSMIVMKTIQCTSLIVSMSFMPNNSNAICHGPPKWIRI